MQGTLPNVGKPTGADGHRLNDEARDYQIESTQALSVEVSREQPMLPVELATGPRKSAESVRSFNGQWWAARSPTRELHGENSSSKLL